MFVREMLKKKKQHFFSFLAHHFVITLITEACMTSIKNPKSVFFLLQNVYVDVKHKRWPELIAEVEIKRHKVVLFKFYECQLN